jgi:uncharacterized protein
LTPVSMPPYPPVTQDLLGEVSRRILAVGRPEKIALHGSHAAGNARPDSDLDILVVESGFKERLERTAAYEQACRHLHPQPDVWVVTPSDLTWISWRGPTACTLFLRFLIPIPALGCGGGSSGDRPGPSHTAAIIPLEALMLHDSKGVRQP